MPIALVLIGLVLIVTAANNTHAQLGAQIKADFTGPQSFVKYALAIGAVGAAGYVKDLEGISRAFMTLIIISIVLGNKGFITNFVAAVNQGPAPVQAASEPAFGGSQPSGASNPSAALESNSQGVGGGAPDSDGSAKFNRWLNYLFGTGTATPAP